MTAPCLHSLPYGETAICPVHQTHDHDERDAYRSEVRNSLLDALYAAFVQADKPYPWDGELHTYRSSDIERWIEAQR